MQEETRPLKLLAFRAEVVALASVSNVSGSVQLVQQYQALTAGRNALYSAYPFVTCYPKRV